MSEIVLLFALLFVKHFLFDYPLQTASELRYKGNFGDPRGAWHSYKHMAGTMVIFACLTPLWAFYGLLDLFTHYLIDLTKVKLSRGLTPADKRFWNLLGLDQLFHNLVYLLMVVIFIYFRNRGL